jgi:hypothetical protein
MLGVDSARERSLSTRGAKPAGQGHIRGDRLTGAERHPSLGTGRYGLQRPLGG